MPPWRDRMAMAATQLLTCGVIETSAFDYDLPAARIAQEPIEPRDTARLLVDRGPNAAPEHRQVRDLGDFLDPGDLLIVNNTRVLRARLALKKPTGGAVEVLLLERIPTEHGHGGDEWEALVRPSRKVAPRTRLASVHGHVDPALGVEVLDDLGEGRRRVRVLTNGADQTGTYEDQLAAIDLMGEMPLPPYITARLLDAERYQTVYAERPASAAAPTAGLHFTPALLEHLAERGITIRSIELVVGLDTFRPIATQYVEEHQMHSEAYSVPAETWETIQRTRNEGGRVVAVGTTAMRALESAAARGELGGRTDLFVHGDYDFKVVDCLMTNFHLPKSSLLVLIAAFRGPGWRDLYGEALRNDYRFLSFGDAMLLTRVPRTAATEASTSAIPSMDPEHP